MDISALSHGTVKELLHDVLRIENVKKGKKGSLGMGNNGKNPAYADTSLYTHLYLQTCTYTLCAKLFCARRAE